jgi:hypothetical protein
MALPTLEAMRPALALAGKAAAESRPPVRMALLMVPNGVHIPDWTPATEGYDFRLPYVLEPLADVQDDLLVLTGLTHDKGRANGDAAGDHARACATFLTGCQARKTHGANIRVGISADQVAAQRIGKATMFPSLELGCDRSHVAGNCDSGYSCAYSSCISWSSASTPVGKETNPRAVFERLFAFPEKDGAGDSRRSLLKRSILDAVAEDARDLQARLGRTDRRKLDEYLTGVRQIEQRIVRAEQQRTDNVTRLPGLKKPDGIPDDYREHIRLMCDMMVLAFQCDLTRVSTFMLANEGSNRSYRFIDVPEGHHDLSHHQGNADKQNKIRQINRFHVEQLAYLLERLKSIQESDDSNLLDHCMIAYGSALSDGNAHNNENLPILLAGHGGGSLRPGRHVRYEQETPMANLLVSMLDRIGAPVEFLGDSTGRLDRLT